MQNWKKKTSKYNKCTIIFIGFTNGYVCFSVPESYDSFKALVKNYTALQLNVIFERLIKSNHPSLEPENKKKMLILAEYVIQLVNDGDVSCIVLFILT